MPAEPFRILGISGSLRRASLNTGLIRAAREMAPEGVIIEACDISSLPFFNADLEEAGDPTAVAGFKSSIRAADALLIATPEYSYNIPGGLKNAIDWASRPEPQTSVLYQKPVAIIGATFGLFGTTRAQLTLRQVLTYTESLVLPGPELLLMSAATIFDSAGNLEDEETRTRIASIVRALVTWTRRLTTKDRAPG